MPDIVASAILMIGLLNPFLVIIYLLDAVEKLSPRGFRKVLVRAGLIATGVFCCFAVLGDVIFSSVLQADFASFQIFGGIVFLLIGLQFGTQQVRERSCPQTERRTTEQLSSSQIPFIFVSGVGVSHRSISLNTA